MNANHFYSLKLALYCSSIVIGAGLLTLPLAAARLGFIPLILVIVVAGLWMAWVGKRTAESLFNYVNRKAQMKIQVISTGLRIASGGSAIPKGSIVDKNEIIAYEVIKNGSRILPELTLDAGFGLAGRITVLLGMFLYVFFADIGYVLIGSRSLNAITQFVIRNSSESFVAISFTGLSLLIISWKLGQLLPRPLMLHGTLKKILVMAGAWAIGIGVLGYCDSMIFLKNKPEWINALQLALFTCAVLAGMFTKTKETNLKNYGDLKDQHKINVVVMLGEIFLLAITVVITIWVTLVNHVTTPFFAITAESLSYLSLPAWAKMIGLVIFAFVGTGLFNLLCYPKLFEQANGSKISHLASVVILGTVIPMIVYLIWTIMTSMILTPVELSALDSAKEYTTIGIARKFENFDQTAALLITVFGYSVALLAVTSACNGFTESLADQVSAILYPIRSAKSLFAGDDNLNIRLLILCAATISAFAIDQLVKMDISSILAVAGNAGGGLLVLILPFFLPVAGERKSRWSSIMVAMMTAFTLTLLCLSLVDIAAVQDLSTALVAIISILIAFSIIAMAIWLVRSEPSFENTED